MTNENVVRRIWVAAAVVILGAGVVGRELIRSGTVGGSLWATWYGQAGAAVVLIAVVAAAGYLLDRAYRNRSDDR